MIFSNLLAGKSIIDRMQMLWVCRSLCTVSSNDAMVSVFVDGGLMRTSFFHVERSQALRNQSTIKFIAIWGASVSDVAARGWQSMKAQ